MITISEISLPIQEYLHKNGMGPEMDVSLAGTAGSQRVYYRLTNHTDTLILMTAPVEDIEFGRFLRLTQFYRLLGFPVPMVYCIDDQKRQVLLEDLGNERLFDLVQKKAGNCLQLYKEVVDTLLFLQTHCYQRYNECPDIFSRLFDEKDLLWETDYFTREYLGNWRGMDLTTGPIIYMKGIFKDLAVKVASQPLTVMHRDFQSQNIMFRQGKVRVIDYQSSRLGSVYYDLASLLLDPYVELTDNIIEELFCYFHLKSLSKLPLEEAIEQFYAAGCQRICQALGAYCFLSRKKGLKVFERYIIPGEKRLSWLLPRAKMHELQKIINL